MKQKIIFLFFLLFLLSQNISFSQVSADTLSATSTPAAEQEEDFNLFLFAFAAVAISLMIGIAMIGALASLVLLFLLAAFISFGIVSVSVMAGLYKRSATAGFKAFIYIVCALAGIATGVFGYWIIDNLFTLSISDRAGLLAGGIGGFLGGLLLAFIATKIIAALSKYFQTKFSQTNSGNR
jgi:hypothetical protein